MKKLITALALMLASVVPAQATTIAVTNDSTMTVANNTASAGDTVTVADATYTVYPQSSAATEASPIYYIGNMVTPANVVINTTPNFNGYTNMYYDDLVYRGMKFAQGLRLGGIPYSSATEQPYQGAERVKYYNIEVTGSLRFAGAVDSKVDTATVTSTGGTIEINWDWTYPQRDTLMNVTWTNTADATQATMGFNMGQDVNPSNIMRGMYFKNCVFDQTWEATSDGQDHPMKISRTDGAVFEDVKFEVTNNRGGTNTIAFMFRDYVFNTQMNRDTIIVDGTGTNSDIMFSASGDPPVDSWVGDGNFDSLYVRHSSAGRTRPHYQDRAIRDTITNSVFIDETNDALWVDGVVDGLVLDHNTFVTGNPLASALRVEGTIGGEIVNKSNIFYNPTTLGQPAAAVWFDAATSQLNSNYNLFSIYGTEKIKERSSYYTLQEWQQFVGKDANSVAGSPWFADSTISSAFDADIGDADSSFAVAAGEGGSDIGARQVTTDTTAPDSISTLIAWGVSDTYINLIWKSVGDDSSSGTADSYEIRYATEALTFANFDTTGTIVGNAPTPQIANSLELFIVSELANNTEYWLAIKVSDELGNQSGISNVVNFRTRNPGSGGGQGRIDED
jgi:hypothetical protein